ncbi:MAG: hypothetical protein PHO80_05190 [Candidatus Gracilibacteria bacterium]|nr:hypothetical protein [Candidatus Gracilibacteria bacterium]
MSSITLENIPDVVMKRIGNNKIDINNLSSLSLFVSIIKESFYDKKTETYGPFEGKDAIQFLNIILFL